MTKGKNGTTFYNCIPVTDPALKGVGCKSEWADDAINHYDWIRIGLKETNDERLETYHGRGTFGIRNWDDRMFSPADSLNDYWVEVLHVADDEYLYRVGTFEIPITESQYHSVRDNPSLYYFTEAYKLHVKIVREGMPV